MIVLLPTSARRFSALPGLPIRIPAPKRGRKPQNIEHRISNTEVFSALPGLPTQLYPTIPLPRLGLPGEVEKTQARRKST